MRGQGEYLGLNDEGLRGYNNPVILDLRHRMQGLVNEAASSDDPRMALIMLREATNTFDKVMRFSDKFVVQDKEKIEKIRAGVESIKEWFKQNEI
jgi:hypothetical protein